MSRLWLEVVVGLLLCCVIVVAADFVRSAKNPPVGESKEDEQALTTETKTDYLEVNPAAVPNRLKQATAGRLTRLRRPAGKSAGDRCGSVGTDSVAWRCRQNPALSRLVVFIRTEALTSWLSHSYSVLMWR
jgi:hypothetical protein